MGKSVSTSHTEDQQRALNFLRARKQAYQATFPQNLATETVLADLAKFCRAGASTFDPNDRVSAMLEGRREVWLRISEHLNMSEDQLYNIYVLGVK